MKIKHISSELLCFCIPDRMISKVAGFFASMHLPQFILDPVIKYYCFRYGVDTDEALYPEGGFKSFDDFFTRKLKSGIHKTDTGKKSVVSPVDGRIDRFGDIKINTMIQAKGVEYSLNELIPDERMNSYFLNGFYVTIYLSPADYHRIHSPVEGEIIKYSYYPGRKYSVRSFIASNIKNLYSKNERLISYIYRKQKLFAVCKIGAMNVGNITLSYSNKFSESKSRIKTEYSYPAENRPYLKKGSELGIFHLGSTVILLFQRNTVKPVNLSIGKRVRVGEKIAVIR